MGPIIMMIGFWMAMIGTCISNIGLGICGIPRRENEKPNVRRDNVAKRKDLRGNYKSG